MEEDDLIDLVDRRHPEYADREPHWTFLEACYFGGREWFANNIFKYMKEGDGEFEDRVERAYRFNHTREVVDLVNKYLFRSEVSRVEDKAPKPLKEFWGKATKKGLSINELMRVASTKSSVMGRVFMVIDNSFRPSEQGVALKADEKEGSIYGYLVNPLDVVDLAYDERGHLNWILLREWYRDDEDPFTSTGDLIERFRLWTRQDWILVEVTEADNETLGKEKKRRATLIDEGEHGLGEVPVVAIDHSVSSEPYFVPGLINDIAYLDRATANYASNLDAIIQDQAFSQLAMPAQNVLPGDDVYEQLLKMGTKRIFLYDGESGRGPEYLSPDPRQASLILSAISQLIGEIYHSVGLAGERTKEDNSKGIDNSSGVAKTKDFERVVALLAAKADALALAENRIAKIVCLWAGEKTPEEDLVKYTKEFDVRGIHEEMDIAMKLSVMDLPYSVRAAQSKGLIDKLFPMLADDVRKEMVVEIEDLMKTRQENAESLAAETPDAAKLVEEAKRSREDAGTKQSATKDRETDPS